MTVEQDLRCQGTVWGDRALPRQCKRAAWKNGYCQGHHPRLVAERRDKRIRDGLSSVARQSAKSRAGRPEKPKIVTLTVKVWLANVDEEAYFDVFPSTIGWDPQVESWAMYYKLGGLFKPISGAAFWNVEEQKWFAEEVQSD